MVKHTYNPQAEAGGSQVGLLFCLFFKHRVSLSSPGYSGLKLRGLTVNFTFVFCFFFTVYGCFTYLYICTNMCLVSAEARRGLLIPWNASAGK